jgi:hypothetical protein
MHMEYRSDLEMRYSLYRISFLERWSNICNEQSNFQVQYENFIANLLKLNVGGFQIYM